jgi:hypothetical protein
VRLRTSLLLVGPAVAFLALFLLPVAAVAIDALRRHTALSVCSLPAFWPSLAGSLVLTLVAASVSTWWALLALHLRDA